MLADLWRWLIGSVVLVWKHAGNSGEREGAHRFDLDGRCHVGFLDVFVGQPIAEVIHLVSQNVMFTEHFYPFLGSAFLELFDDDGTEGVHVLGAGLKIFVARIINQFRHAQAFADGLKLLFLDEG